MYASLKKVFVFFVVTLIFGCENDSNLSNANIKKPSVLRINNSLINFSVQYEKDNKPIFDPLTKDTIVLNLNYEKLFKKVVNQSVVEIVPNVRGCYIQKLTKTKFLIFYDEDFQDTTLIWTLYLRPQEQIIFNENDKRYYKANERIFIAEKQNNIINQ